MNVRPLLGAVIALLAVAAAGAPAAAAQAPSPAALRDLAPTGTLRVTFILANPVHVVKDPASGELRGPAIDLGRELARRLGVPFEPVGHARAQDIVASAGSGAWDVAFLAYDAERTRDVDFSPAYLEAHNTYLVPAGAGIRSFGDVDRPGVRIGLGSRDAVDLHLTRTIRHATLVRTNGSLAAAVELLSAGKLDVYAANRHRLGELAVKLPGARVLEGSLLAVQQAIALPKGRPAGLAFVAEFLELAKASGLVQHAIDRAQLRGVNVAPASR